MIMKTEKTKRLKLATKSKTSDQFPDVATTRLNKILCSQTHARLKQTMRPSDVSSESDFSSNQESNTNNPDQRKTEKKTFASATIKTTKPSNSKETNNNNIITNKQPCSKPFRKQLSQYRSTQQPITHRQTQTDQDFNHMDSTMQQLLTTIKTTEKNAHSQNSNNNHFNWNYNVSNNNGKSSRIITIQTASC